MHADDRAIRAWRQLLTSYGWLSRVPDPLRSALLSDVVWHAFGPGDHLITAGEEDRRELIGLCDGVLAFTAGMGPPDTPPIHLARPASWFGYSTLFTGEPARITATARTKGWVVRIAGARVRELVAGNPDWWPQFLHLAGDYGDLALTVAADLAIRGSERRLVAVLLRMSGHRHPAGGPTLGVVPINQGELAAACNLSRNTANGIVRGLASRGLISVARSGLSIDRPAALLELAEL